MKIDIDTLNEYKVFRLDGAKAVAFIVENNNFADIKLIQVEKEYRSQGLGHFFISYIKDYYKKNEYKSIILHIPEKSLDETTKSGLVNFLLFNNFKALDTDLNSFELQLK